MCEQSSSQCSTSAMSEKTSLQHCNNSCKHISVTSEQADQGLPVWEDSQPKAKHLPVCATTASPGLQLTLPALQMQGQAALTCFLPPDWYAACAAAATFCVQQAAPLHLLWVTACTSSSP